MAVCNYVAVFCIKDDTGARALELALAGTHVRDIEKPAEEGILEQRILRRAFADGAAGGDIHDGRRDALDHGRERRHRGVTYGLWQRCLGREGQRKGANSERESRSAWTVEHVEEDTQTM